MITYHNCTTALSKIFLEIDQQLFFNYRQSNIIMHKIIHFKTHLFIFMNNYSAYNIPYMFIYCNRICQPTVYSGTYIRNPLTILQSTLNRYSLAPFFRGDFLLTQYMCDVMFWAFHNKS